MGVEQAQVVVQPGERGERGARAGRGGGLADRDRGREAVDEIDVRAREFLQRRADGGRQAFQVAALPLGENRVEREGTLARPGKAGDDRQAAARQAAGDVGEIVGPRAADDDPLRLGHGATSPGARR